MVSLEDIFPCWSALTEEQRRRVREQSAVRLYEKGRQLHRGKEDCSGLFMVRSGQLRVYLLSERGKEVTLYRLFDWDICLFSASCVMKNISFDLYVEAEKDTEVFTVPAELYEELMKLSLPIADYTNQLMASRFSDVMWVMEQILFTSFDSRLASFLLEQSKIDRTDVLRVTHEEIARHMGSAREVVTKMLNYLSGEGLVSLARGQVTLLNKKGLEALIQ